MPRFPALRRLSSISDYKPKKEIKAVVIEQIIPDNQELESQNVEQIVKKNNVDSQVSENEEKEQFAIKQLKEFVLSHPKIINPITGKFFIRIRIKIHFSIPDIYRYVVPKTVPIP